MFTSVALGPLRYACALTLGLVFNVVLFAALSSLSSVTLESESVVATRIEFTRLRREMENVSPHKREKPQMEVPDAPRLPQLELTLATAALDMPLMIEPTLDMRAAFKDARVALGYETDVIAVVRIPPSYPRPAKLARIQGYVTMEVVISPEGLVTDVSVVDAAPPRMFDIAAVDAMKRWKFRPRLVNGVAVSQRAHQTIEFKMEEG